MFSTVVAMDSKKGIATDNIIPWHFSEDLKFFRELTENNVVIMGRKTYESIGKPLPNRINIVITRGVQPLHPDVIAFNDMWRCVDYCLTQHKDKKLFVIGGEQIYKWFLENNLVETEYVTQISNDYSCNVFYPSKLVGPKKVVYICDEYFRYELHHTNTEEYEFLQLGKKILETGVDKSDRTGTGTLSIFGQRLEFDLSGNTFPLLTTRKMFIRGIFEELMLYLRGQTDSSILESKGINVWTGNTSRSFLDAKGLQHLPVGDMGPSYGFLFRHFGAEYKTCKDDYKGQGVDQLYNLINTIKNNPNDRRLRISLWDPANLTKCPLPPCLEQYQFYVENGKLSCMMTQRSSDYVVAGGWNVATGALLTYLISAVTDLTPNKLIWNIGDTHVYKNVKSQLEEQVARKPYLFPKILINKRQKIEDFEFDDIKLLGYKYHGPIQMVMNI
jgi:dihydrofolate reductase/thymidylate synthase